MTGECTRTCRLVSSTPGFVDKLGPSAFKSSFRVPRNEAMVEVMRKRLGTMLEMVGGTAVPKDKS